MGREVREADDMINVRGIANSAIQPVNPNIVGVLRSSTGFTTNTAGKRTATYAANASVILQVQAARSSDLEHVENLNLQETYRNVRMWGNTQGVVRVTGKGGDLLQFPEVPGGTTRVWLVVAVLETWPEWCSLIVCLQTDVAVP